MIRSNSITATTFLAILAMLFAFTGCKKDLDGLEPATFPAIGEVFIDGFSPGLDYAAFGGSDVRGFDVVSDVVYEGTAAMRFAVPDVGDPAGAYVGGTFFVNAGRDLSGFDALVFWIKASKNASIDVIGFGNDLGENKYVATLNGLAVNTNWKQVILPLPDPSVLTQEKGMFFYSEGPESGLGYTFWIDEVEFVNLGTLAQYRPGIQNNEDAVVTAETGQNVEIGGLIQIVNLPNGQDQTVNVAPAYYDFTSSNTSVATISDAGVAMVIDAGSTTITATLAGVDANGSLTIESTGDPILPPPSPVPTKSADSVISLWSNAYDDVTVDTWDTDWEFTTTETDFIQVDGDDIIRYRNLNFVGIEFVSQTIDVSEMTRFHMNIWTPDMTDLPAAFKVLLVDFGPNNTFDGGDDTSHELTFTWPVLQTGEWVTIDVPMSAFTGLTGRMNLAQMVLSGDLPNVFVDNVYFYIGAAEPEPEPQVAAPTPTRDAADVISVFSDAYDNIAVSEFNPNWGQSGSATQVDVAGNNTLKYANFNYQGTQFAGAEDMSEMEFVHIDMWTDDATDVKFTPISAGTGEFLLGLAPIVAGQWNSYDIPLSSFTGMSFNDIIQLKFDGQGGTNPSNIWLDNIYFYKEPGGGDCDPPQDPSLTTSFPIDFESCEDLSGVFESGDGVTGFPVANPDQGAGNPSDRVYQFNKVVGSAWYSGIFHIFPSNFDMTDNQVFKMKIWSPKPNVIVRFQIEKEGNQGPVVTYSHTQTVSTANTWTEVEFDFSDDPLTGPMAYDKIVIIPDDQDNGPADGSVYYIDDIELTPGSGGATEPTTAAPAPTQDASNVISVFSDAYTDIAIDTYNPNWGQSGTVDQVDVAGNNTLKYSNFNYQGTQFAAPVDMSQMEFVHIDLWTADATNIQFTPISASTGELLQGLTPIVSGEWNSYDIPVSAFAGVSFGDILQLKFDGQAGTNPSNIWLDNIYFYKTGGGATEPTTAAPAPTQDASNVISVFSDAYTDIAIDTYNPNWGQSGTVDQVDVAGNNTLKYSNFNYQGTQFAAPVDMSEMEFVHIDLWTADATNIQFTPISASTGELLQGLTPIVSGEWNSYDIPVSAFAGVSFGDILQLKFDGQAGTNPSNIWLDNIYFYKTGPGATEPTTAAPTPTNDAADVISVFSDAYTDIAIDTYNPNWGQSGTVDQVDVAGNNTLKYSNFNYQGTQFAAPVDMSQMEFVHIDLWTADATNIQFTPISASTGELLQGLTPIVSGTWNSYDIPLSAFSGVGFGDILQLKFDGQAGTNPSNIWLDNIYFYKTGGGGVEPSLPLGFENGETLIAFDGGAFAENVPNPDPTGNPSANVLKFVKTVGSAWYSGVVFDETLRTTPIIDLADGTVFTMKVWSPNAGITVRFQVEGGVPDPGTTPSYEVFQTVNTANQWVTLTFDFTSQVNPAAEYNRFSIFPDFDAGNQVPVATEAIYYFDDITQQ